jgi:hypothetical protein
LTAAQYRTALDRLGLTQADAARFLGVGGRTSRRWASEGGIPPAIALLLRLMIRLGLRPKDVKDQRRPIKLASDESLATDAFTGEDQ